MGLKLFRYEAAILNRVLSGKPLSGTFPWECQWLVEKASHCKGDVLEIGTYKGATARELALALPEKTIYSVDIHDPSYGLKLEQVGEESRGLPNVKLTIADSRTFAYPENLGLIFIDGDHSWEGIKADTNNALKYFRGKSGTIIWHDYDPTHECMPYLDWLAFRGLNIQWVQCTQLAFLEI